MVEMEKDKKIQMQSFHIKFLQKWNKIFICFALLEGILALIVCFFAFR